MIKSTYL